MPGVEAASSAELNVFGRAWTHNIPLPGTPHDQVEASIIPATEEFLETLRIPLRAGRTFTRGDVEREAPNLLIANETFVRRYFGNQPALGRTIATRFGDDQSPGLHEIIGVVADTRHDLRKPAEPILYIPISQRGTGTLHVRVSGDEATHVARLREDVRASSPFRVTTVSTQAAVVDRTLLRERLLALLAGFFAVVGLALATVGLYGVLSYSVVQRTREIGLRMALGAPRRRVVRTVVAETGAAAVLGAACGLGAAVYLSRFVAAFLFEVTPHDLWSLALPLAILLLASAAAASLPVLRATRIDPVEALRHD
jgi:hypothetical protein